jgi:hypothetical protein
MSEQFLSDLTIREAPRPRRTYSTAWLALPVFLAVMFGLWAIAVDGRWATGLGFCGAGAFIAWGFRRVR